MANDPTPWTHEVTGLRRLRRRQLHYFGHAPPAAYPPGHQVSRTARVLDSVIAVTICTTIVSALYQLPGIRDSDIGFIGTLPYGLVFGVVVLGYHHWTKRQQREEADPERSAST